MEFIFLSENTVCWILYVGSHWWTHFIATLSWWNSLSTTFSCFYHLDYFWTDTTEFYLACTWTLSHSYSTTFRFIIHPHLSFHLCLVWWHSVAKKANLMIYVSFMIHCKSSSFHLLISFASFHLTLLYVIMHVRFHEELIKLN